MSVFGTAIDKDRPVIKKYCSGGPGVEDGEEGVFFLHSEVELSCSPECVRKHKFLDIDLNFYISVKQNRSLDTLW